MYKTITVVQMNPEDKSWYDRMFPKHTILGWLQEGEEKKVVVEGSWTPNGTIRDCGKYYIAARYAQYDKIMKRNGRVYKDVVDR